MNKRDTKFVSRILWLSMLALTLSIGARVVLESEELTKVVSRTALREFLIVFAPLAGLMGAHYYSAIKSFGIRSLQTEGLIFVFLASLYLAVVVLYFSGEIVVVPSDECEWWRLFGCSGDEVREENYLWSVVLALIGFGALFLVLKREKIFPSGQ